MKHGRFEAVYPSSSRAPKCLLTIRPKLFKLGQVRLEKLVKLPKKLFAIFGALVLTLGPIPVFLKSILKTTFETFLKFKQNMSKDNSNLSYIKVFFQIYRNSDEHHRNSQKIVLGKTKEEIIGNFFVFLQSAALKTVFLLTHQSIHPTKNAGQYFFRNFYFQKCGFKSQAFLMQQLRTIVMLTFFIIQSLINFFTQTQDGYS